MSSILNALKKLENEQPRQEQVQSLSGTVHSYKRKTYGVKRFRVFLIKTSTVGLIILVLVAGGFIGFNYISGKKSLYEEKASMASLDVKAVPITPAIEAVSPPKKDFPPTENRAETPGKSSHKRDEQDPSFMPRQSRDNPVKPVPEKPVIQEEAIPDPGKKTAATVNTKLTPAEPRTSNPILDKDAGINSRESSGASSSPALEPPVQEDFQKDDAGVDVEPREIPVLPAGELKLMAIAWSDDPSSRIAVINGGIIREGGSIGGAHIERIDADEVIVRKNNRVYRLVFRLK